MGEKKFGLNLFVCLCFTCLREGKRRVETAESLEIIRVMSESGCVWLIYPLLNHVYAR